MPAFNVSAFIARAIESALVQSVGAAEVLVIDDHSTDDTVAVVGAIAQRDPRVRLLAMPANGGPSAARNAGIRAAQGDWVALLDADDAWAPNRLEILLNAAQTFDAEFVADNQFFYDAEAKAITRIPHLGDWKEKIITAHDLFASEIMGQSEFAYGDLKPLVRRAVYQDRNIWYREDLRFGEDTIIYAEMLLSGVRAVVVNQPLYYYTTRLGELSGAPSPSSRSAPRFFDLLRVGQELENAYNGVMDDETRHAMQRRSRQIEMLALDQDAREARRSGNYVGYVSQIARHPSLAMFIVRRAISKIRTRAALKSRHLRNA